MGRLAPYGVFAVGLGLKLKNGLQFLLSFNCVEGTTSAVLLSQLLVIDY